MKECDDVKCDYWLRGECNYPVETVDKLTGELCCPHHPHSINKKAYPILKQMEQEAIMKTPFDEVPESVTKVIKKSATQEWKKYEFKLSCEAKFMDGQLIYDKLFMCTLK